MLDIHTLACAIRNFKTPIIALVMYLAMFDPANATVPDESSGVCGTIVKADVVAIEQAYLLNRFSAFVPAGMLFALRRDVVPLDDSLGAIATPGNAMLRPDKRPRPIVLRVNEGDCLEVTFTNFLSPVAEEEGGQPVENGGRLPLQAQGLPGSANGTGLRPAEPISVDTPRTRAASFHIAGLEIVPIADVDCPVGVACGGDGTNVGLSVQKGIVFNPSTDAATQSAFVHGSLAKPGQTVVTLWHATRDGAYFAHSMGAPVGGEGDGGQIGLGLFGAVNVEPAGARWYRSQVTHDELQGVSAPVTAGRHPYMNIDYEAKAGADNIPLLNLLDDDNNIVHSDLNAIIVPPVLANPQAACLGQSYGTRCGQGFREFTVIFHDEVHAQQAFPELEDENNPLHLIKDGMGINYGVSSMGSLVMASKQFGKAVGPVKDCPECRAEEFFLSSWANGDPALLLRYDDAGKAAGALYSDDPSNVHHSYLGDNVRFRNLHAGPKETHVFHLHAHQWVPDPKDPSSTYLDSQTISPGATFSYDIEFGGSGNRNYTPGDSIFHCHLYPHFAQGMWELWRSHDAFTDGQIGFFDKDQPVSASNDPRAMNLPDQEIASGTETPALVPIPGAALAPMPTAAFRGYPYYIPGEKGHRPPQPVLDFDVDAPWADLGIAPPEDKVVDGGLPRHVVVSGTVVKNAEVYAKALETGGAAAQVIAKRVAQEDPAALQALAGEWETLDLKLLAEQGTDDEQTAMQFHEGTLATPGLTPVAVADADMPAVDWWRPKAYATDRAAGLASNPISADTGLFFVNGRGRAQGAPYAEPCPDNAPRRDYRAAFIQTELTYNKHGWFDPQGRIIILENDIKDIINPDTRTQLPSPLFFRANSGECINFKSSNFVPSALNVDDFQIYMPTDTIGQHIHLVKFDVTSSDGSGNGFNYEDATFSPQEVRDRIFAYNRHLDEIGSPLKRLTPKTHPLFAKGGDIFEADQQDHARYGALLKRGQCPPQGAIDAEAYETLLRTEHDLCGAQRTTQRWWADPVLNAVNGRDNTLRTVFTHDHLGPSSHQQHGLYAGLVIEPANSVWGRIGATLTSADLAAAGAAGLPPCNGLPTDPNRSPLCNTLIGGSNIAAPTDVALLAGSGSLLQVIQPRPALKLRDDGGPTSTMANILAPQCVGDSDSYPGMMPEGGRNGTVCPPDKLTHDSRREFALAIADFGIAYDTALQPINPEPFGDNGLRDKSDLRFGRRNVYAALARPLAISSEDPGSQYFNYRNEPLALRISEASVDPINGGWTYRQNTRRATLDLPCTLGDQDCLGDTANGFSTAVHAKRDALLATTALPAVPSAAMLASFGATVADQQRLQETLADVERWRRRFNCALYSEAVLPISADCPADILRAEPWRQFGDPATPILPAYEGDRVQIRVIQGAQEAQHVFAMNGVKWHRFPGAGAGPDGNNSGFVSAQPVGISEHFEFDLTANPLKSPVTDYLYYGSSVDQMWDGLWGVLRTYRDQPVTPSDFPLRTSANAAVQFSPRDFLAPLPDPQAVELGGDLNDPCASHDPLAVETKLHRYFEVSAVRACDLFNSCGTAAQKGITYNRRLGIEDQDALVYVLESRPATCTKAGGADAEGNPLLACDELQDPATGIRSNAQVMQALRAEFAAGRKLEPLVLHAAAGQCIEVSLRNMLPPMLDDGPVMTAAGAALPEARAYYNFFPMITDGFNVNQFRMSSSVGLSPTGVFQHPSFSDGSNVGLNSAVATRSRDRAASDLNPFVAPPDQLGRQGSLVPPCVGSTVVDGAEGDRCRRLYRWSATDFMGTGADFNRPVEFGAVPLRSFGDSLKHAGHGLIGALVIGPVGSHVCADDRFAYDISVAGRGTLRFDEGPSTEICKGVGKLYVDHTLVVQDAIFATDGGMPVENLAGAEEPDDYGVKGLNYRTEPLWGRTGNDPSVGFPERAQFDQADMLSSDPIGAGPTLRCAAGIKPDMTMAHPCDPETPILMAKAGETVRMNFVHSGGHTRQQGLAVSGHPWNPYPWIDGSRAMDRSKGSSIRQGVYNGFGPMMGITLEYQAGGTAEAPLDYLYRSQASFLFDGGIWGILRVEPKAAANGN